jgi:hypothetical protein
VSATKSCTMWCWPRNQICSLPSDAMEAAAHLFAAACNRRLGGVAHSPQHYCEGTPHAAEPASLAACARFKKSNAVATLAQTNIYHCKPPLQGMRGCQRSKTRRLLAALLGSGAHISMYRTVCVPLRCFFLICAERNKNWARGWRRIAFLFGKVKVD